MRVSAAWRGLADNHRAKRLIKKAGIFLSRWCWRYFGSQGSTFCQVENC